MQGTKRTEQHIANLLKAKFPIIYIESWEENRIIDLIKDLAKNTDLIKTTRSVYVWSSTTGIVSLEDMKPIENTVDHDNAINKFNELEEDVILIIKDLHEALSERASSSHNKIKRLLRDTATAIKADNDYKKNIILISPVLEIPVELQKDITVVDFELPSQEEIKELLNAMIGSNLGEDNILSQEDKNLIAKTALGLTLSEAENAFARAIVERKQLTINELDIIMDEKCQVIKKTGILEFVKSDLKMEDVGGLQNLKHWLIKRNNSWLDKAQKDYNLPAPKGVLITGIAGCGKSLTAKAMSSLWKLPLLRLDAGKIFDKWVGGSEENIRKVIKTAEAVAPCILWIDEIEKGFSQGSNDGGTTTRVFGTFLTWMQEKTKSVFVVATANNISSLPPEFMRKGRFDEIFFVDIPTTKERKVIFKLHLNKMLRGSISENFSVADMLIDELVEKTEGFVGAEIEQAVISAVFDAFAEDRKLHEEDLFKAIENTVPLSVTQAEQIEKIREWANARAVAATSKSDRLNIPNGEQPDLKLIRGGRNIDF